MMLRHLEQDLQLYGWIHLRAEQTSALPDRARKKSAQNMDETSDQVLVLRTRGGQVEAFGDLVRRYQRSVYNVCYRLLGERREAEDLAQEVFIRAYRRLETFDAQRPFGPWIRRVATNLCYNHLQKSRFETLELDEERDFTHQGVVSTPERSHERRETAESVRAAILELPPAYRAVIELRHYQEMSYTEIADTLEISISQVKSHLFRARRALANRLTGTGSLRLPDAERGDPQDAN